MRRAVSALMLVLFAGCTGEISDPGGEPPRIDPFDPPPEHCEDAPPMLGVVPIRRLSRVEYENTVADLLFGLNLDVAEIPADQTEAGFENASRHLSASPLLVERHEVTASTAGRLAMADSVVRARVLPCDLPATAAEQGACAAQFLATFGRRAFRRPLTSEEREFFLAFIADETARIDFDAAIELAIGLLMQSPQFNYRIELGRDGVVSQHEMASRLSYLIYQSMPDEVLLAAADAGELGAPAQIEAQARRMLEEPRARQAMIDFHRQWLELDAMLDEPKNAAMFPDWGPSLRDAIREEADRFVGGVFDGDGSVATLLSSRTAWVNAPLAAHYGLDPVSGWTEVQLPADERAGILTRANFLAGQAHETNGSPVLRGVFVIDRLLCGGLASPPDDADTSSPEPDPTAGPQTNRMLFEERTAPAECQVCHEQINGIGFGFESYDATGAYRVEDATLPVDASGELFGTDVDGPFSDAVELSERLADSQTVTDCAARHWIRYTVGRNAVGEDACLIQDARRSLADSGGDFRQMLVDIVTSPDFARGVR